jgi:alkyl sulfatase BDS1-like metallo-beta-lactamase superfamily hydrolase
VIADGNKQQEFAITLENSVLSYVAGKPRTPADSTLTLDKQTFSALGGGKLKLADAIQQGKAKVAGDQKKLDELMGLFDTFDFWFPIVTP